MRHRDLRPAVRALLKNANHRTGRAVVGFFPARHDIANTLLGNRFGEKTEAGEPGDCDGFCPVLLLNQAS